MSTAARFIGSWRAAAREPGLHLLLAAVTVAVAALSSVGFFADRVERALILQGAALIAADLVVEQAGNIPAGWIDQAAALNLRSARLVSFPSVLVAGERPLLVQVKAVGPAYPLRGRLAVRVGDERSTQAPQDGRAWVDGRLRDRLALTIGESRVQLGEIGLEAAGVLENEPDRGGNLFQLAPRLMISFEDARRSGLLGPASRVRYRLLLAGDAADVARMRAWIEPRLGPGASLVDVGNARPELRTALERARRFLGLAALCASLLSGIAIVLATRRYVERALDGAAVLRTLGMSGRAVLYWHARQLLAVVSLAVPLGSLVGLAGQQALIALLGEWFGDALPAPGLRPVLVSLVFGLALVLGFALPTLLRIGRVPPLRVLRREIDAPGVAAWLVWLVGALVFTALMVWQVGDRRLALGVALAVFVGLALFMLAGQLMLVLLRPLRRAGGPVAQGLAALARYPQLTRLQLAGFGLGITLLLVLAVVRVDIVDTWQRSLPAQAPNHFLVNIQPDERDRVLAVFERGQIPNSGLHATTRARLVAINGETVEAEDYADPRARRLAAREYSLGFNAEMQTDNRILAGQWWQAADAPRPAFSVEQGLADSLGIGLGDVLRFDIAGQIREAPVTSLRSVSWDSFNVNFFVVGSPAVAEGLPLAYLSSAYLSDDADAFTLAITRGFPAVSVLDLRPILGQVREVMGRGALAVEMVFGFTLLAAALVTFAAAQVSRDERAREVAVMRTLGASRRQLMYAVLAEFALLGFVGGLLASLIAAASGYLVAVRLFDLPGRVSPEIWWLGIGAGTLIVGLVGWLATRRLLSIPPLQVLTRG